MFARPRSTFLVVCALVLPGVVAGCGSSVGSGQATPAIGGPVGSGCSTKAFFEGCNGLDRVRCDADPALAAPAGKWAKIDSCVQGVTACKLTDNPADAAPAAIRKVSECVAVPVKADAGSTDTAAKDVSVAEIMSCYKSKCPKENSLCIGVVDCNKWLSCVSVCKDEACAKTCVSPTSKDGQGAQLALAFCGIDQKCTPGAVTVSNCGNGKCEAGETAASCKADCSGAASCGNGTCDPGETNANCSKDCTAAAKCGDGVCQPPETAANCQQDCGGKTGCGDGKCANGESYVTCPADCPKTATCGNNVCDIGETNALCPKDCPLATTVCGNGICESKEGVEVCAVDCTESAQPAVNCAIKNCAGQFANCAADAACVKLFNCLVQTKCNSSMALSCAGGNGGATAAALNSCAVAKKCPLLCPASSGPVCGDGKCEGTESDTCLADCGGGGGHFCDTHCGKAGTKCYCDAACMESNDCCNATGNGTSGGTCAGSTCKECSGTP